MSEQQTDLKADYLSKVDRELFLHEWTDSPEELEKARKEWTDSKILTAMGAGLFKMVIRSSTREFSLRMIV